MSDRTQELANAKIEAETELIQAQTKAIYASIHPAQADQATLVEALKDCIQDALADVTRSHPREPVPPWTRRARDLIFGEK